MLKISYKYKFLISLFFIAIVIRGLIIVLTPQSNQTIDLNIYRDGAQLILNDVDPYDFNDKPHLRKSLRLDKIAYTQWVSESQEKWDFYASSNLPLSLYFYSLLEYLSGGDPIFYRIVFLFFDSFLSFIIGYMLLDNKRMKLNYFNMVLILGIGALSPTLLLWGTAFPEEKGVQILLMLLSVLFAKKKNVLLTSLFLGLSIAFKGLGVFVFPVCVFYLLDDKSPKYFTFSNFKKLFKISLLTFVFAFIWFLPFLPNVFEMMKNRMNSNTGINVIPGHSSIWLYFYKFLPEYWFKIRFFLIGFISLIWLYFFTFVNKNIVALFIFLLVLFVDIYLLQGSMDRMNIGIIISLVLFSDVNLNYTILLGWYTILVSIYLNPISNLINCTINESTDSLYILGYVFLFLLYPFVYILKKK